MICTCGKVIYETKRDAIEALNATRYRDKRICVKSYLCLESNKWHVTSQSQDKQSARNQMKRMQAVERRIEKYKSYKKVVLEHPATKKKKKKK